MKQSNSSGGDSRPRPPRFRGGWRFAPHGRALCAPQGACSPLHSRRRCELLRNSQRRAGGDLRPRRPRAARRWRAARGRWRALHATCVRRAPSARRRAARLCRAAPPVSWRSHDTGARSRAQPANAPGCRLSGSRAASPRPARAAGTECPPAPPLARQRRASGLDADECPRPTQLARVRAIDLARRGRQALRACLQK